MQCWMDVPVKIISVGNLSVARKREVNKMGGAT